MAERVSHPDKVVNKELLGVPTLYLKLHHVEQMVTSGMGVHKKKITLEDGKFLERQLLQGKHIEQQKIDDYLWYKTIRYDAALHGVNVEGITPSYARDIVGDKNFEEILAQFTEKVSELIKNGKLPNTTLVKIGAAKQDEATQLQDLYCTNATCGDHCDRRDIRVHGGLKHTEEGERDSYDEIMGEVHLAGLVEGVDYIVGMERIALRENDDRLS